VFERIKGLFRPKPKISPELEHPAIVFTYDLTKDSIYTTIYWQQNIDKSKLIEKFSNLLGLLQTGQLYSVIANTVNQNAVKQNDVFIGNNINERVAALLNIKQEAWLDEPIIWPNQVFNTNGES